MGEAKRTTKLSLKFDSRREGGTNTGKREYLETTKKELNKAREFYTDFFLEHRKKVEEKVWYYSQKHQEKRERRISAEELLTYAEYKTVVTKDHPEIESKWDFNEKFPEMPFVYRRSVIKDSIGRVRSYLSNLKNWQESGKKKGQPGLPTATNHPTLYKGSIELAELDCREGFIRLKIYTGKEWVWRNYPVQGSRWQEQRLTDPNWHIESPKLILRPKKAELHIPQMKKIEAEKVKERKQRKELVTIGVDLNVKNLVVITVMLLGKIIKTVFFKDKGLDQHRYRHTKRISKKQWLSGRPVKGERSNKALWQHVKRTNEDFAHQASRVVADTCKDYPGSVLIFENLRKMKGKPGSKCRKLNRKLANQIRAQIRDHSKQKAFVHGTVTVEVNPHGTSSYCSHCGAKGERFSAKGGEEIRYKGGKLFRCQSCGYTANADFNASVNTHHSFYGHYHWQPKKQKKAST